MHYSEKELVWIVNFNQNLSSKKNDLVYLERYISGTIENSKKVNFRN